MEENKILRLSDLEALSKLGIEINPPPPHRNKIGLSQPPLESARRTLRIPPETILKLRFSRYAPNVQISPESAEDVTTVDAKGCYTLDRKPRNKIQISNDHIILPITYTDDQTENPERTAAVLSSELRARMAEIPFAFYRERLLQNPLTDELVELAVFLVNIEMTLILSGIFTLVSATVNSISGTNADNYSAIFTYSLPIFYLLNAISKLAKTQSFLESQDETERGIGDFLRRRPASTLLPAELLETYVIPSIRYRIESRRHGPIFRPLTTP